VLATALLILVRCPLRVPPILVSLILVSLILASLILVSPILVRCPLLLLLASSRLPLSTLAWLPPARPMLLVVCLLSPAVTVQMKPGTATLAMAQRRWA